MNKSRNIFNLISAAILTVALMGTVSCFDLWTEQHPGTYYTFNGQTVADYLEQDETGRFSDFIKVLQKSQTWGELDTYGTYTCFAPTNNAFAEYLKEKGIPGVDSLTKADCDTIAWNHLIRKVFFMSDVAAGSLPYVNLLNRFLVVDYVADTLQDGTIRAVTTINRRSRIIREDDTVQNGVVQVVDRVIRVAGDYVYDIVKDNPKTSIFYSALNLVGLEDSLKKWHDHSYTIGYDSIQEGGGVECEGGGSTYTVYYVPEKNWGFTLLVEPDSIYRINGIKNLDDLIDYANKVYHESYSDYKDRGYGNQYDTVWTDQRNPLRRFVEYHILPFSMPSEYSFNAREDIIKAKCETDVLDAEDYFETFLPHSLIRVSRILDNGRYNGVYINRLGVGADGKGELGRSFYPGIKVYTINDGAANEGCNGYVHYLDNILEYSKFVRTEVLNRRLRVDCCTLSPDFLTSGARQKQTENNYEGVGFKEPTNFHSFNSDYAMWVRSAFVANISYQGDGLDLQGNYDIMLKLPPIPYDGNWELRLSYRGSGGCGVVQNYVGDNPERLLPCGIPTDLRYSAEANPNIRWKKDDTFTDPDGNIDTLEVDAYDKAMRNRGYMKGPDSHWTSDKAEKFRDYNLIARRIITTDYFYSDRDYWLRMKLVLDNPKAEMNFDYMEWVPKYIYDNSEDKH
ncbi:MAG: fasciclin domain-containing protein [Bacteroidaceae bacterium]|nr:fasciclin domain-containing protein [Bacteroidaceae bacterium]